MTNHPFLCPHCRAQISTEFSVGGGYTALTFTLIQAGEPPVNPETTLLRAPLTPEQRERWLAASEATES